MLRIYFLCFILLSCSQQKIEINASKSSYQKLLMKENSRTIQFEELVGHGVIEFYWEDDDGKHREQGDFDFWKSENSLSLRISKIGELIFWIGGSEDKNWMFDFSGEKSLLRINDSSSFLQDSNLVLQLMALAPLQANHTNSSDFSNVKFDGSNGLPFLIEKQYQGNKWVSSLRKPIGVELDQTHKLNWPKTPSLIDISSSSNNMDIKIVFDYLSTIVDSEPMNRVFNLSYLKDTLNPDYVE